MITTLFEYSPRHKAGLFCCQYSVSLSPQLQSPEFDVLDRLWNFSGISLHHDRIAVVAEFRALILQSNCLRQSIQSGPDAQNGTTSPRIRRFPPDVQDPRHAGLDKWRQTCEFLRKIQSNSNHQKAFLDSLPFFICFKEGAINSRRQSVTEGQTAWAALERPTSQMHLLPVRTDCRSNGPDTFEQWLAGLKTLGNTQSSWLERWCRC